MIWFKFATLVFSHLGFCYRSHCFMSHLHAIPFVSGHCLDFLLPYPVHLFSVIQLMVEDSAEEWVDKDLGNEDLDKTLRWEVWRSIEDQGENLKPEIEKMVLHANRAYYPPTSILKSHADHRDEKIKYINLWLRPVIPYGGEAWTLNTETKKKISCFWEEGSWMQWR